MFGNVEHIFLGTDIVFFLDIVNVCQHQVIDKSSWKYSFQFVDFYRGVPFAQCPDTKPAQMLQWRYDCTTVLHIDSCQSQLKAAFPGALGWLSRLIGNNFGYR